MMDPAAVPFTGAQPVADEDSRLDADIIRPALFDDLIKTQEAVPLGSVPDVL